MKKILKLFVLIVVLFAVKDKVLAERTYTDAWKIIANDKNVNWCGPYVYIGDNKIISENWDNFKRGINGGSAYLGISEINGRDDYYAITTVDMSSLKPETYFGYMDNYKIKNLNSGCPKYISTNMKGRSDYGDSSMKRYVFYGSDEIDENLKDNSYIFKYIEESEWLDCKYTINNIDIFLNYYDNGDTGLILPSFIDPGGPASFYGIEISYREIAEAWHNYRDKIYTAGNCPDICGGTSNNYKTVRSDSFYLEIDGQKYIEKKCVSSKDNSDGSIAICGLYEKFMNNIMENYENAKSCDKNKNEYCNVPYILAADKKISEINELCTNVVRIQDSEDGCVIKCFAFDKELKSLKQTYNITDVDSACGLSSRIIKFFANIFRWVKYIAPVLAIILGILDFIKAIISQNDDDLKKAQSKFLKRLIAAALLFIVPFIIEFILDRFNFAKDNPYCNLL